MESSIWNTSKKSTKSTSVWDSRGSVQPKDVNVNTFNVQHVYKAIPVFSTILTNHVEFNKYLKEVILEHRQKFPESTKSNVKAWHSSWLTHEENPKFQPLIDVAYSACDFITKGYFQSQDLGYKVMNLWAMMYEEGEHTIKHSHFPSDFSAAYYVDVEPGCAPVLFEVPKNDGVNDRCETLTIQPENGMFVIWPAILHHEVPPTKGRRMAISMNIDKTYCHV